MREQKEVVILSWINIDGIIEQQFCYTKESLLSTVKQLQAAGKPFVTTRVTAVASEDWGALKLTVLAAQHIARVVETVVLSGDE